MLQPSGRSIGLAGCIMLDLVFIASGVVFFLVTAGYADACQKL